MAHKLTPAHLQRRAIIYVRQSTPTQLLQNRESQLRQYRLADYARDLGFNEVETIDEDLGRSGSGLTERPGFQRLALRHSSNWRLSCCSWPGTGALFGAWPTLLRLATPIHASLP